MSKVWELVEYECQDGKCLVVRNILKDSKLCALSLDHRGAGEAIVEELNKYEDIVCDQQLRISRLELHLDVLQDVNNIWTLKMFAFMQEMGVFDEWFERMKKGVDCDE